MFVEAISTIGTLANAYEIGKKSQPRLGKLIRRIRDRKLNLDLRIDDASSALDYYYSVADLFQISS
jgi:hypothetical protein